MTGRQLLDRNARRLLRIKSGLVVCSTTALIVGSFVFPPLILVGLPLALVLQGFYGERFLLAMRCPWCGGDIGSYGDWPIGGGREQVCSHCGTSMDDELPVRDKPKKGPPLWDELA
jgi:hypothetical protein